MLRLVRSGLLLLALAAPVEAQLAPLGAPKGTLRFTVGGQFESADRRLLDGHEEDYLADFGSPALGSDRFAFLRAVDTIVGQAIGQSGYKVNLGGLTAHGQYTAGTGIIGLALGVTRKLTLYTNIPFVTVKVRANLAEDSLSGDAGINIAHPTLGTAQGQTDANQFFNDFSAALQTLDAQIANGTYNGNPALLALAQSISARGARLQAGLAGITNSQDASAFLPTATSAAGVALTQAIPGRQDPLATTRGVGSSFTEVPVLPDSRLGAGDVTRFLSNAAGPINALPLTGATLQRIGDMDVGAVYTLVDRFDRIGQRPGGFRLAVEGKLKLPTGLRDNPNNLLHVGTGNGRYELTLGGTADLGSGNWGARFTGGYTRRFASLRVRRVAPPDVAFPEAALLSNVRYKAGDVLAIGAQPFFRLARNFALAGSADYWREASGSASYYRSADAIPGVPASVLVENSARRALMVGGGLTYVGRAVQECEGRRCGFPIDASWRYSRVIAGSGGRVPEVWMTQLEIRWYQRLWR